MSSNLSRNQINALTCTGMIPLPDNPADHYPIAVAESQGLYALEQFAEAYRLCSATLKSGGLHILNTTIIPSQAGLSDWRVIPILRETAESLLALVVGDANVGQLEYPHSHLGHQGTVDFCRAEIPKARGYFQLDRTPWDGRGVALVVQLNGRIQEGQILTEEELRAVGASWRLLYCLD